MREEDVIAQSNGGHPTIIQGGMGVAVSGWELANAVAAKGQMGVVSGTALDLVCSRRLQLGDAGGHVRRALEHFPVPEAAQRVLDTYYVPGGKDPATPFKNVRSMTITPSTELLELLVIGNFVEVYLAKENVAGPVGINFMRKIELPLVPSAYGALLAGVDYVIVGAGNPRELPEVLNKLAMHEDVGLALRVQGTTSADGDIEAVFSPRELFGPDLGPLRRPPFLAIVASLDLAAGLANSPAHRPEGFVVEGNMAGGHNAPPRGPRRMDDRGQPIYDELDVVDLAGLAEIGLPFWLAGSYATPDGLKAAQAAGAVGIQVGTAFALSAESGIETSLKRDILGQVATGGIEVRTDWRASPTGFPFKVVEVDGTLSDPTVYEERRRVCDLGVLRVPFKTEDGNIGYRCPAEPERAYTAVKAGRPANMEGRICLCNGLLATAGLAQVRPSGYVEPPVVTGGSDYRAVEHLMAAAAPGEDFYTAADVIDYLL
jgi:NAD(P)H-dependent flavin oxidoreductase YrpB (nitropropane dioxygenase family)